MAVLYNESGRHAWWRFNNHFFNHDKDTPIKQRVSMLRKLISEIQGLKDDQYITLIKIYDKNVSKPHEMNSKEIFIIGNLSITIGWLIFNACAVMY